MISTRLNEDMKLAMKSRAKDRLSVIRMLLAELKNARIALGHELSEEEEEKVIASYAKQRKETMDTYKDSDRDDLAAKEEFEYELTMSYLPPRMEQKELEDLVVAKIEETGAGGMKDFGRVMKAVMASVGSRADGSIVSATVKRIMNDRK